MKIAHKPTARALGIRSWVAVVTAAMMTISGLAATSTGATALSSPTGAAAALAAAAQGGTVSLPRTARAMATINDWNLAPADSVAEVWPEVGSAKSGSTALGIDAPVVSSARIAASADVRVAPSTTYRFEAYARVMSKTMRSVPAQFVIDQTAISLPALNGSWKRVAGTYTTGADVTSTSVAVRLTKAVRGLSIDAMRMYAVGDPTEATVIPNGSFESLSVKSGIANTSLIMTTPTAMIAAALPAGTISWEVLRGSKRVKSGSLKRSGVLTPISLSGVPQGYYTFKVQGSDRRVHSTAIAILDSPTPWIAQDTRFGVATHVEEKIYADAARHARAVGLGEVRNDVFWEPLETVKGTYNFAPYDGAFAKMNAQGLGVLAIAGYGNPIYGESNRYAPRTATAVEAYAKFSAAVAKRYKLRGLEVFNEFNHPPKNKSNCTAAACYAPLLKAVDAAVGKVNPKLPIVAGSTARYPDSWFRDLWKKGGLKQADAVSFHPYEITGNPEGLAPIVTKARKTMKTHGKTTKPVWITELGTSARTGNRTTTEQASVLTRAAVAGFSAGASKFYWYDLINDTANAKDQEGNFGLYAHPAKSPGAALAPKPAAFAQALTITQLGGRAYRSSEALGAKVVSHGFGTASNLVRVVWATSGVRTATVKTSKPIVIVDFNGTKRTIKPKKGVVKIKVTTNPVFVRSGSATAGVTR